MFQSWKVRRQIKRQCKQLEGIRKDLASICANWHPRFAPDNNQQQSRELLDALRNHLKQLDLVYYVPNGGRVFPLYEEIHLQIQRLKRHSEMFTGYTDMQDAVLKIGAAIRALINTTGK